MNLWISSDLYVGIGTAQNHAVRKTIRKQIISSFISLFVGSLINGSLYIILKKITNAEITVRKNRN